MPKSPSFRIDPGDNVEGYDNIYGFEWRKLSHIESTWNSRTPQCMTAYETLSLYVCGFPIQNCISGMLLTCSFAVGFQIRIPSGSAGSTSNDRRY